jgi:adenylate kinase family enzyme
MKGFDFPIFKTKIEGIGRTFRLEDPIERREYFKLKAGKEIEKLRDYLQEGTFVVFLLGKKNSGKGTYSKLFMEQVGSEHMAHVSVGDIVRAAHKDLSSKSSKKELIEFLKARYRGARSVEEVCELILAWGVSAPLLPTEAILALVEREVSRVGRKAIFIDGFPRNLDQVSYSLYFRALMGYRDDPDFFVFIDVPEQVIHERMKYRVICPLCQTPRNLKLLRTKEIGYDLNTREPYLVCDREACGKARMVVKEGDELGIEAIRDRIEVDENVMRTLLDFSGIPKIYLRNTVPVDRAREYIDEYEITPAYRYVWDGNEHRAVVIEEPWIIKDDDGVHSYSLLPQPITIALIKGIADILGL